MEAVASDGASLIPSPIINTCLWAALYSDTIFTLSSGKQFACTLAIFILSAMALAVSSLSPVNITGWIFNAINS